MTVKKKDKSLRVCLDARFLNSQMCKDHVVPPKPEEFLTKFGKGQILSSLDMTASYWQIPIKPEHRKYTGFSYNNKTYCFKVLPFGLSTSVASFIRTLQNILGVEVEGYSIAYVDDLLIFSNNPMDNLNHLDKIFEKFKNANLTIKLRKPTFACKKVAFLGHIVSGDGVRMNPERILSIKEFPRPQNLRELRGFLGLVNYDRRFCQ